MRSYANNLQHRYHATFRACKRAPWPEWTAAAVDPHSFMFAAFAE